MSDNDYYRSNFNNKENKIEPFDSIEVNNKKYIPQIPSVQQDILKNNKTNLLKEFSTEKNSKKIYSSDINYNSNENDDNNGLLLKNNNQIINAEDNINKNSNNNYLDNIRENWDKIMSNPTIATIINPYRDDGPCINKIYKIYSCITITLILFVIILSIVLS